MIVYFGKFLPAKGVGELMLSIPAVLGKIPQARFLFIGFGSFRENLEGILQALKTGDLQECINCAEAGGFTADVDFEKSFRKLSAQEAERITITGFLNHNQLKEILPLCDVCIVPSKLAEAFGMVAVEAMAAGVLPVCNYHSGLGDVIDAVTDDLPKLKELISMDKENFTARLPGKIIDALKYLYPQGFENDDFRRKTAVELRAVSKEKFSWDGICRKLID